jgi:outer membrane protein
MRLITVVGACALVASAPSLVSAQGAAQKFAFVNTQMLLQSAPGAVEAQQQFQKESETIRAQVTKLSDSLTALDEAYKKEEVSLSPAAKEARMKTLRDKQTEFQDRASKLQEQADQRQGELMQPIYDLVRRALDDVRTEGGYSFIFDVAAGAFIVSADKNLDVTDRVAAKMRLVAPKAAATKPPASGPTSAPSGIQTKKPPTE